MNSVQEIADAIAALPREEFWLLTDKVVEMRDRSSEIEREQDVSLGRLDELWQKAEKQIAAGEIVALDEFLHHEKFPQAKAFHATSPQRCAL